jgi:hypothetical protein
MGDTDDRAPEVRNERTRVFRAPHTSIYFYFDVFHLVCDFGASVLLQWVSRSACFLRCS